MAGVCGHAVNAVLREPMSEALEGCNSFVLLPQDNASCGITYDGSASEVQIPAYTDAESSSSIDGRRSVSGTMVMIGGIPVVFKSKYRRTVALSSVEANNMALSLCTQKMLWVRTMLKNLDQEHVRATVVWKDSQGAIGLASNASYNVRRHPSSFHPRECSSKIRNDGGSVCRHANQGTKALGD